MSAPVNQIDKYLETAVAVTAAHSCPSIDVSNCHTIALHILATVTSAVGGCSLTVEGSLDNTTYLPLTTHTITATSDFLIDGVDPSYKWLRVTYAISSGAFNSTVHAFGKG